MKTDGVRHFALPVAAVLSFALAIAAINPVGYLGGGGDDWQYLEAARCAVAEGFCLPESHWAARWPIVLPTAAAILLGETRAAISLVPLVYGLVGIVLFTATLARRFGRIEALIGGLALVATPIVGGQLTALNIASLELCFVIAAIFCLQSAIRGHGRRWAIGAGVLLGLAILARATSLALVPIAVIAFALLPSAHCRLALPFALGLAGLLGAEAAAYLAATGDPFYSWKLALGHSRLETSELAAGVDRGASPLFNPDFIAGWPRAMGIRVHWTIDAALNLLADPRIGMTLVAALALLVLKRRDVGRGRAAGRIPAILVALAALYFGALTYGLAIDPTPRMFLPVAAAGAAIVGILGGQIGRGAARAALALTLTLMTLVTAAHAYEAFDIARIESAAARWAAEGRDRMAVDETARRVLTLVSAVRRLPAHPAVGRDRRMLIARDRCQAASTDHGFWSLVRSHRFAPQDPLHLRGVLLGAGEAFALCEYARAQVPNGSSERY